MKLWKKWKHAVGALAALAILTGMAAPASAAEYDSERRGSITVQLSDIGTEPGGVGFRAYRVSDVSGEADFFGLDKFSSRELLELAAELEEKAASASAFQEKKTDGSGKIVFSNLPEDLYLISQSDTAEYGTVAAFLVEVPRTADGTQWVYDVVTNPKGEPLPEEETPGDDPEKTPSGATATPIPTKSPSGAQAAGNAVNKVKTGDETPVGMYVAIAAAAIAAVLGLMWKKRQKRER